MNANTIEQSSISTLLDVKLACQSLTRAADNVIKSAIELNTTLDYLERQKRLRDEAGHKR